MAFGLRRGGGDGRLKALLARDGEAVSGVLGSIERNGATGAEQDLERSLGELFEAAPTRDVEALKERGIDHARFWQDEVRPNWDGLGKEERAAKVESFARFANSVGDEDAGGIGPVVRTKLLVLAWAYDTTYGEDFGRRLARKPERFGKLELAASQ